MVEDTPGGGVSAWRDVDACLFVEPPGGQSQLFGDVASFVEDDPVWLEDRVDVSSGAAGVVGQSHGGATEDAPDRTGQSDRLFDLMMQGLRA